MSQLLPLVDYYSIHVLGFCLVILAILIITRKLFYGLVYAVEPEAKSQRFRSLSGPMRLALAIADLAAWFFAFVTTCLIYQFPNILEATLSLFAIFWNLLPLTLIIGLIVYGFSRTGNELILSLLGFWYLRHRKADLDRCRYFELEDGQMGEIEEINLLDTRFRLRDGGGMTLRPNAYLMHEFLGFSSTLGIEGVGDWLTSLMRNRRDQEIIMQQNEEIMRQNNEIMDILVPPKSHDAGN